MNTISTGGALYKSNPSKVLKIIKMYLQCVYNIRTQFDITKNVVTKARYKAIPFKGVCSAMFKTWNPELMIRFSRVFYFPEAI